MAVLIAALVLLGLVGALSLYYFSEVSHSIGHILRRDITVLRNGEKLKGILEDTRRLEKLYFEGIRRSGEPVDIGVNIDDLQSESEEQLELAVMPHNREYLQQLLDLVKKYRETVKEAAKEDLPVDRVVAMEKTAQQLTQQMEDLVVEFLTRRYQEMDRHHEEIEILVTNANRNMLLFLFLCVVGGLVLVWLAPSRVAEPFQKFIRAIREVEELKFDTKLPEIGYEEVAQVSRSINRLIDRVRVFDELKQKKILFEARKQRVLANMVDLGVMMLTLNGEILFMNSQLAKILKLKTESYRYKNFRLVALPEELKDMVEDILKKKQRVDSRMLILMYREKGDKEEKAVECNMDASLVRNEEGEIENIIITFEDISNPIGQSVFKRISIREQELLSEGEESL